MKQRCAEETRAFSSPYSLTFDLSCVYGYGRKHSLTGKLIKFDLEVRKKWLYHSVNPIYFLTILHFINSLTHIASWILQLSFTSC